MPSSLFPSNKFLLIAGPCTIESASVCQTIADVLADLQQRYASKLEIVFKGSFDKANRTDVHSPRGLGLSAGLEILSNLHQTYGLKTTTDIHLPEQAALAAKVCDILQIPAFLCRQTDLLAAAAATQRVVSVKKGQFLSPWDASFIVEKLRYFHAKEIWLLERGTCFGYGNLVVDMRSFPILKQTHCPVIFDATHSLQHSGKGEKTTGGDRQFLLPLAQAALAAGAQGLFMETHPHPEKAWSDQATQVPLEQLPSILKQCLAVWECMQEQTSLSA